MDSPTDTSKHKFRFLKGIGKTKNALTDRLSSLISRRGRIDPAELDALEDALIMADAGVEASSAIVDAARKASNSKSGGDNALHNAIRNELLVILSQCERAIETTGSDTPLVIMMVGVNGVGKTTTAAKIAHRFQAQGQPAMLAACDTYRAAAVEQLQLWGERTGIPVIAHSSGGDPAAVAHDAMHAALAKKASVLILDTAGRQHSRDDLMRQVEKIRRVVGKIEPSAPHETLITLDATTGQNAISQVESFNRHVPLTAVCVTKLDGTAKGGIVIALASKFQIPIAFVGYGEKIDDLFEFRAAEFADSLLSGHESS